MGIGDWGLGIGDWGLGIGPNPQSQSPIPNPQSPIPKGKYINIISIFLIIKIYSIIKFYLFEFIIIINYQWKEKIMMHLFLF